MYWEHIKELHVGRHCCLWCTIPSAKLIIPLAQRGRSPSRTLETLRSDHVRFLSSGGGDLKVAKEYNNVIEDNLLDIPIDHVWLNTLLNTDQKKSQFNHLQHTGVHFWITPLPRDI